MTATGVAQETRYLDEALRLNHLALTQEHEKLLANDSWRALSESRALLERADEILSERLRGV
jgi:hypothetical protein